MTCKLRCDEDETKYTDQSWKAMFLLSNDVALPPFFVCYFYTYSHIRTVYCILPYAAVVEIINAILAILEV